MDPVKPGYKTTQFYLTAAAVVLSGLVTFRVVPAGDAARLQTTIDGAITSAAALLSAAWTVATYIESRTRAYNR